MPRSSSNDCKPSSLDVAAEHLAVVRAILRQYLPGRKVVAFGSRTQGNAKPTSDLDLCILGEDRVSPTTLVRLRAAFSDSHLPFKVDLLEWAGTSATFRRTITKHAIAVT